MGRFLLSCLSATLQLGVLSIALNHSKNKKIYENELKIKNLETKIALQKQNQ